MTMISESKATVHGLKLDVHGQHFQGVHHARRRRLVIRRRRVEVSDFEYLKVEHLDVDVHIFRCRRIDRAGKNMKKTSRDVDRQTLRRRRLTKSKRRQTHLNAVIPLSNS